MPSSRAAAAPRSPSSPRSGGRSTVGVAQRRDVLERAQLVRLLDQRAPHGRLLADRARDRRLERPVAAQQVGGGLLADPLGAGQPVRRVAAQRDEVGHGRRRDAVALLDLLRAHLVRPLLPRALEQDRDPVARALEHVAVAGEDLRQPARGHLRLGVGVHEVVGLEVVVAHDRPAERLVERRRALPLVGQRVGHRRAMGVVGRIEVGPVGGRLLSEAAHDGARLVALDAPQELVDRAEQRIDGPAVGAGDGVREREEPAIEQMGRVGEQQGLRHARGG